MPDTWETFFGLDPNDATDATGNPNGDGLTNAQEFAARRHPVGRHARHFAEGSTGFFDTLVSVLNLSATDAAHVALALLTEAGTGVSHPLELGPRQRQSISINTVLGVPAAVSIIVESDLPVAADRSMTWDTTGVGLSLDSGSPAPFAPGLRGGGDRPGADANSSINNRNRGSPAVRRPSLYRAAQGAASSSPGSRLTGPTGHHPARRRRRLLRSLSGQPRLQSDRQPATFITPRITWGRLQDVDPSERAAGADRAQRAQRCGRGADPPATTTSGYQKKLPQEHDSRYGLRRVDLRTT